MVEERDENIQNYKNRESEKKTHLENWREEEEKTSGLKDARNPYKNIRPQEEITGSFWEEGAAVPG